ncbi:hypothetical protein NW762_012605 [Fusarium torreyae]|uniref:Ricin B lectin domain-containing protein n=1 Tax=Fusarium torreyae TaxID=1237075 RepID=A0A9W8RM96_9HYPO|nr:hypothetical protein NW762_012605 [Fusarium torreyae]
MTDQEDLKPASDIDSNVWYQISEENVDDYDGSFESMLQTWDDGGFRVFPVANRTTYWQFQPINKTSGRYSLRCSETTTEKQFAVCYRSSESVENRRTQACLQDSDGSDAQQWDIALWGRNDTYRFINVANGSNYLLDVIPGAEVYMSPNLSGYQKRQRWLMTSVSDVDDAAYSTVFSNMPLSTMEPTTTADSASSSNSNASVNSSDSHSKLSNGAVAGIAVGSILGVLIIALVGFFLWRRKRRNTTQHTEQQTAEHNNNNNPSSVAFHGTTFAPSPEAYKSEVSRVPVNTPPPVYEMTGDRHPVELPAEHT